MKYFEILPVNDKGINTLKIKINNAKNKNKAEYAKANNHTTNKRNGLINCKELTDHSMLIFGDSPSFLFSL